MRFCSMCCCHHGLLVAPLMLFRRHLVLCWSVGRVVIYSSESIVQTQLAASSDRRQPGCRRAQHGSSERWDTHTARS